MMHGHEKSRSAIVAVKPTNKAERSATESVERRAETKGNVDQQRTRRTQRRISVSQMLARIRQHIVAVDTQGGNRMRESCTYGSVRGVRGNSHPYRAEAAGVQEGAFGDVAPIHDGRTELHVALVDFLRKLIVGADLGDDVLADREKRLQQGVVELENFDGAFIPQLAQREHVVGVELRQGAPTSTSLGRLRGCEA